MAQQLAIHRRGRRVRPRQGGVPASASGRFQVGRAAQPIQCYCPTEKHGAPGRGGSDQRRPDAGRVGDKRHGHDSGLLI
eukprot:4064147-Alexandrium_andersonii.AAC.1